MITVGQAIERLAERTSENKERWRQALRQRRTEYTDIYGIPYVSETGSNKTFEYHIAISPDLEYYERFQFKLLVKDAGTIDPNGFRFYMGRPADSEQREQLVELTDYLEEQQGEWIDGNGYFPEEDITNDSDSFYDILDAVGLVMAEDRDEDEKTSDMNAILSPGNKLVRITSDTACDVTLILFAKYSTINR